MRYRFRLPLLATGSLLLILLVRQLGARTADRTQGTEIGFVDSRELVSAARDAQEYRIAFRNRLAREMAILAARLRDPEVGALAAFFRDHFAVVDPSLLGLMTIRDAKEQPAFAVVVLLPGDERVVGDWGSLVARGVAPASYHTESGVMAFGAPDYLHPTWVAICAFHETHHARHYLRVSYRRENVAELCAVERDAHAFQNRLMSAIGGEPYRRCLAREVKRLQAQIGPHPALKSVPWWKRHDREMDRAFGPALSEREWEQRTCNLWIHAIFSLINARYEGDREAKKAQVLQWTYQRGGILPP